jgi:hypothetical protein
MSLKVFDLQCEHGHVFEGWFGSAQAYETQQKQGLLMCPVCNSQQINKKLSAPRLNVSHIRQADAADSTPSAPAAGTAVAAPAAAQMAALQAQFLQHMRKIVREADDVGSRFAEEARRMHEGEAHERAIRGTATPDERAELAEEGIAVMPIPDFLDDERLQ